MIATSAGAPMSSVPRSSKAGNTRAALTVADAITWLRGNPSMMNFDRTFGKSMTLGLSRELAVQSVERVSGQKPCLVARSTTFPFQMTVAPVAPVEDDAAPARRCHVREYAA